MILGRGINMRNFLSVLGVSFIISLIISLTGFLNAKFLFATSSIGLVVAIIALLVILSRKTTGWEDLIGPLAFLQITVLAFAAGIVLEFGAWFLRRIRRKADEQK